MTSLRLSVTFKQKLKQMQIFEVTKGKEYQCGGSVLRVAVGSGGGDGGGWRRKLEVIDGF